MPAFLMLKMGNGHEKQADSEGGAVHVVPRKKKYIWDLIQEGCGYPNRN